MSCILKHFFIASNKCIKIRTYLIQHALKMIKIKLEKCKNMKLYYWIIDKYIFFYSH